MKISLIYIYLPCLVRVRPEKVLIVYIICLLYSIIIDCKNADCNWSL